MTIIDSPVFLSASATTDAARLSDARDLPLTIEVARVVLVIGLVFLHYFAFPNSQVSPFDGFDPQHHPFATFVNSFVLLFFFSAVPLLSTISGWLFFNISADPLGTIARRIRGRVSSLFLPLVAWNAATLLIGYGIYLVAPTSELRGQFQLDYAEGGAFDYLNALLGLTRLPIAFQFWFVRDLFLSVLLSPLLWLMLRHAPLLGAIGLGLAWLLEVTFGIFVRTDVLFFFYLGGMMRIRGVDLHIEWRLARLLLLAYVLLMAVRALAPIAVDLTDSEQRAIVDLATRLTRPLGVVACWGLCLQLAALPLGRVIGQYGGFAFFLHAAHFPLIAFAKFALWSQVPAETDGWMLAHYAASVALTVSLAALAAAVVFRISPTLYGLIAGGRRLV